MIVSFHSTKLILWLHMASEDLKYGSHLMLISFMIFSLFSFTFITWEKVDRIFFKNVLFVLKEKKGEIHTDLEMR